MSNDSFFNEQKEQSLIKARIVEKYFWAWAKVIIGELKRQEQRRNSKDKYELPQLAIAEVGVSNITNRLRFLTLQLAKLLH